jgi:alpha-beta hydrolase superfamily lysophospholipase
MQKLTTKLLAITVAFTFFTTASTAQKVSDEKTIVLLHGLFQNAHSWEHWAAYYKDLGYTVYTPSLPYHRGEPDSLNQHIHPDLVDLEFKEALDSITAFVDRLSQPPIVVGHSIGGLITQKLVEAGKAEMGIMLASANPRGISVLNWKYIRSNFRMVSPFRDRNKVCTPSFRWFKYTFFNTLSDSAARAEYQQYFIPESRKIAKSSTKKGLEIDFDKPHVPMLFVAGEKDNDLPPPLIRKNYQAYTHHSSVRDYYEFPDKSHYIASEPGWEEVAKYVARWIAQNRSPSEPQRLPSSKQAER